MKDGEDCTKYAKRVASMIYTKKHGKTPQEAEKHASYIELIEELLSEMKNEQRS